MADHLVIASRQNRRLIQKWRRASQLPPFESHRGEISLSSRVGTRFRFAPTCLGPAIPKSSERAARKRETTTRWTENRTGDAARGDRSRDARARETGSVVAVASRSVRSRDYRSRSVYKVDCVVRRRIQSAGFRTATREEEKTNCDLGRFLRWIKYRHRAKTRVW